MPSSYFDSMIKLDAQWGAITVVSTHGLHAAIVFETLHPDTNELEIRFADFLPNRNPNNQNFQDDNSLQSLLKKTKLSSLSDNLKDFFKDPIPGRVRLRNFYVNDNVKKELSEEFGIDGEYCTYRCEFTKLRYLIGNIRKEQDGTIRVADFQIRGIYANNGKGHNCYTWVIEKLETVGIDYKPNFIERTSSAAVSSHNSSSHRCVIS